MTGAWLQGLALTYRQRAAQARRIIERDAVMGYEPEPWILSSDGSRLLDLGPCAGELHTSTVDADAMRWLLDSYLDCIDAEVVVALLELLDLLAVPTLTDAHHAQAESGAEAQVAQLLRQHRARRRSTRCHERRLVAARAAADDPGPGPRPTWGHDQARSHISGGHTRTT